MELLQAANAILVSFQTLLDALDNPPKPRGWQTKLPVRKMKYALIRHNNDFKENIDSLLGLCLDEESALAELCENPQNEKWKDTTLAAALVRECAKSYEGIQNALGRMRMLLGDIENPKREIEVPLSSGLEDLTLEANRIDGETLDPFVSTECIESRKHLLDQFGNYNNELRKLVCPDTALPAVTPRKQLGPSNIHKPIVHFWHHAKTLYDFVSKSWHCHCRKLHQTNLLLQHRESHEVQFNLLFIFGSNTTDTTPWAWQDITLKPMKPQDAEQFVVESVSQKIPEHHSISLMEMQRNGLKAPTKAKSKTRKSIFPLSFKSKRAQSLEAQRHETHSSKKAISNSSPSPSPSSSANRKVAFSGIDSPKSHANQKGDNLCETFKAHRHQQKWDQVLSSGHDLYSLSQGLNTMERRCAIREKKTLGNLLDSGHLNHPECCLIALILASSVYQLHSSPWLQSSWDNKKIVFFSSFTDASKISMDKPFLSDENFSATTNASPPLAHGPGDLVIESLGIALLELCFNKTLESFPEYRNMGQVKSSHTFSHGFATTLLPRAHKQLGTEFADAIDWCLTHRQISLEDNSWRNELFINVIIPLYDVYITNPLNRDGISLISEGIIHKGDIRDGGVGNYGTIILNGGTMNFGGKQITHYHPSKTLPE